MSLPIFFISLFVFSFFGALVGAYIGCKIREDFPRVAQKVDRMVGRVTKNKAVYVPPMTPKERQELDDVEMAKFKKGFAPSAKQQEEASA